MTTPAGTSTPPTSGLLSGAEQRAVARQLTLAMVALGLQACGFQIRAQIVWVKQHFAISRGAYHWRHEPCWYAVRRGQTGHWRGDRTQSTVWEGANLNPFGGEGAVENEATGHGAQKPLHIQNSRRHPPNQTKHGLKSSMPGAPILPEPTGDPSRPPHA